MTVGSREDSLGRGLAGSDDAASWYALSVRPRHEFRVCQSIEALGVAETFLPVYQDRRRWSDRLKTVAVPLFPGYVFARLNLDATRVSVLRVSGVVSFVGFGGSAASVPESEIESVRTALAAGFPVRVWPFLKPGQPIRVDAGPLRGAEGVIVKQRDEWHMVVTIGILQRAVAVTLPRAYLSSVNAAISLDPRLAEAG